MKLRKNIVSVTTDRDGNVTGETADYIGVEAFAKEIYNLYKECLDKYDDNEEFEQYINDLYGEQDFLKNRAYEFAIETNEEMKKYLHRDSQHMDGNFADLYEDYPKHITGVWWASDYDGDDYYDLYPQMVARLDAAEDSEQANKDRAYLEEWYFKAFGAYNIQYNFSNELEEIHSMMEEAYEEA